MSTNDRACHNAVTNNDVNSLALNRAVVRGDDGHFSHRIKSQGITNQKKSGRCWMFAGLNVLRPQVIRDHRMAEFEFSAAYLQFWDKLEKSNLFLESVIELRDADFLDRDWEMVNKFVVEDSRVVELCGRAGREIRGGAGLGDARNPCRLAHRHPQSHPRPYAPVAGGPDP